MEESKKRKEELDCEIIRLKKEKDDLIHELGDLKKEKEQLEQLNYLSLNLIADIFRDIDYSY
ncbi:29160_t:CDS:1, partial [Gigaspora margarita]